MIVKSSKALGLVMASDLVCLLCSCQQASAAKVNVPVPAFPDGIHIKYEHERRLHPLPAEFVDQKLKEINKKIAEYSKQPNAQGKVQSYSALRSFWENRNSNLKSESLGESEYWGNRNGALWSDKGEAYAYSGTYSVYGHASDLCPGPARSTPEWMRVDTEVEFDTSVPYLGIAQPGKALFSGIYKCSKSRTTSDGREMVFQPADPKVVANNFVLLYDGSGILKSITVKEGNQITRVYRFGKYKHLGGTSYPGEVRLAKYRTSYNGKTVTRFPSAEHIYRIVKTEAYPSNSDTFSYQHPPIGIQIQDMRYKSKSLPDGVSYRYSDPNLTLDESSRLALKEIKNETSKSSNSWIPAIVRLLCFGTVIVFVGRATIRLIRRGENR